MRECVFSAPRSRREPGRRERGSARGGRRGGAASRGQGGPGVTGGQGRKISFSNLLPSVPPRPRFFFLLEALGCESRFLSSRQNGLCVSGGGEGRRWGRRRRRRPGLFFILVSSFPRLLRAATAGRARGRPPAPAQCPAGFSARVCRRDCPFPAASLPDPEAPPRTRSRARMNSRRAEDPRPRQAPLVGPARPGRRGARL